MSKIEFVEAFFKKHYAYYRIELEGESLDVLHQLCQTSLLDENKLRQINDPFLKSECHRCIALYYKIVKNDDKMLFYLLSAVEANNDKAMNNLGSYYEKQDNIEQMMKYYLMAIKRGNSDAMNNLGSYYADNDDFINAVKYYQMAIKRGNSNAMYYLGLYYQLCEDHDNMKKYLIMAMEKGNMNAAFALGSYYDDRGEYSHMMDCYLAAFASDYVAVWNKLEKYITNLRFVDYFSRIYRRIQLNRRLLKIKDAEIAYLLSLKN